MTLAIILSVVAMTGIVGISGITNSMAATTACISAIGTGCVKPTAVSAISSVSMRAPRVAPKWRVPSRIESGAF